VLPQATRIHRRLPATEPNVKAARRTAAAIMLLWVLPGCSLAPAYRVPPVVIPENFKEAAPWIEAQPADVLPRGAWWSVYNDPKLAELERRLDANSPDLAAAFARYVEASSYDEQARAGLFPTVAGLLDPTRNRQSDTRPLRGSNQPNVYNADTVGVQADYELDLWGRVHNLVAAAHAESEAAAADLASAKLSLEVRLAEDYVDILGEDRDIQLLLDTVSAYEKALSLTETLHAGGVVSGLDVSRARTQLNTAKAQVSESRARRALLEHAIAALVGESPSVFSLPADMHTITLPEIPAGVPTTLLQRRPDIAAAERRTAAANATIGVARAAYFPSLDLSAALGFQSTSGSGWLTAPSTFWAIGPMLTQTIFEWGALDAQLTRVRATLDETAAKYRSTVLTAFQQVEDALALLGNYKVEYVDQSAAVEAAQKTLAISMTQYRDGGADYLNVVDAQTATLSAQRSQLGLETRRLRASIDLVRALGGGWNVATSDLDRAAPEPGGEVGVTTPNMH
jgi:NodT family efflux transporter outer membrane factor (OMF) lipoprotein